MKLRVSVSQSHDINLDRYQMAEVTEAYVSSVFDLRGGDHVDGDHLAFWYDTGHGSGAIEKVRPATDDDRLAVSFLRRLRELEIERNRSK